MCFKNEINNFLLGFKVIRACKEKKNCLSIFIKLYISHLLFKINFFKFKPIKVNLSLFYKLKKT